MAWTRRGLLGSVGLWFAQGQVAARGGVGGDRALLGMSQDRPSEFERRDLFGEWKDPSWRRVVWRFEPGPRPNEVVATWLKLDGSAEAFRGVLIRGRGGREFLDLAPAFDLPPLPDQLAPHRPYKLAISRVDAVSIGTPRQVRKEFDGKVAKSFHRLYLMPPKAAHLRDLPGAPEILPEPPGSRGPAVVALSTTPAALASFLEKHGNTDSLWKPQDDSIILVRKLVSEGA